MAATKSSHDTAEGQHEAEREVRTNVGNTSRWSGALGGRHATKRYPVAGPMERDSCWCWKIATPATYPSIHCPPSRVRVASLGREAIPWNQAQSGRSRQPDRRARFIHGLCARNGQRKGRNGWRAEGWSNYTGTDVGVSEGRHGCRESCGTYIYICTGPGPRRPQEPPELLAPDTGRRARIRAGGSWGRPAGPGMGQNSPNHGGGHLERFWPVSYTQTSEDVPASEGHW